MYKKGIYAGVWDLLHPGHLYALDWAGSRCDHLTAALNVAPDHKDRQPIETADERHLRLAGCKYVDAIIEYSGEASLKAIYSNGQFDVAFISEEYKHTKYTDPTPAIALFVPRVSDFSSSKLKGRIEKNV